MQNHATFRFYKELNDFLSSHKKDTFRYSFGGTPSVKDAIEANGIPHVEVNFIRVNGEPVDFTYRLKDEDMVEVYPVSEISLRKPKEIKFILDVHLGKLAKYLRMCGFDSLYRNDYEDREIIEIALKEDRTILTRDLGILKVKIVSQGYFMRNQNPKAQLIEILKRFDLYDSIKPFSRCVKCNGEVASVDKQEIIQELEPLTKKHFTEFYRCLNCRTIYWEGSHFDRMNGFIRELKNSAK